MMNEQFILKSLQRKLDIIGNSVMSEQEIQKAFTADELNLIEKAKYIRREGTKGNYKYIYEEPKVHDEAAQQDKLHSLKDDLKRQQDYINSFQSQNKPVPIFAKDELNSIMSKIQQIEQSEKKETTKGSQLIGKILDINGTSSKIKNISQEKPGGQYRVELENGDKKFINDFILDKLLAGSSHKTPKNPYSDKDDSLTFKIKKSEDNSLEKAETGEKKVAKVMREFKEGKLKDSHGNLVTDRDQAIAIAMSEAGIEKK